MNWLGLICGVAIVAFIAWGWSRRSRSKGSGAPPLPIEGLGYIRYSSEEYDRSQAEVVGLRLREVQDNAWAGMVEVYGKTPEKGLNYITLNSRFKHIIKLRRGPGNLTMRPQGGFDHPMEFWFSLEMHNLFRCRALGYPLTYLPKTPTRVQQKEWDRAQRVCIEAAESER